MNAFEALAREKKAERIATQFEALNAEYGHETRLGDRVETLDDTYWRSVARMAGVHAPSDITKQRVVEILHLREATRRAVA